VSQLPDVVNVPGVLTEPAVSATALAVWLVAARFAAAAQVDRPTGPAPTGNPAAARRALVVVRSGLVFAATQLVAGVASLAGVVPGPRAALAWPALTAVVTGALLVWSTAVGPLRVLASGRPLRDARPLRGMHAGLRTGVAAGALAAVATMLGTGLRPVQDAAGPYLAPVLLVVALIVVMHATLRAGSLTR